MVANLVLLGAAAAVARRGARSDRTCAEVFAFIALVASLPSLLLNLPGGSAYYFINVGSFAAVVFVSAYGGPLLLKRAPNLFTPKLVLAAIILVTLATDQKVRSPAIFADLFADDEERTRGRLGDGIKPAQTHVRRLYQLLTPTGDVRRIFAEEVSRLHRARAVRTLLNAGLAQTPDATVFVTPDNTDFWISYRDCRAVSLFIPAILGVPMIRGLNPTAPECHNEPNYGFPAYGPDSVSQPSTDAELCARAGRWGLRTVFVLSTVDEVRKVDCKS